MPQPGQLFPGYRPRKVQETVLYETVQEHWPARENRLILDEAIAAVRARNDITQVLGVRLGILRMWRRK